MGPSPGAPLAMGETVDEEKRCRATSKQTGERCKQPRKGLAPTCHYHGGNSPGALVKAREKAVEIKARKLLTDVAEDFDPLGNPLVALEDMARRMVRFTDVLGGLVSRLESIRYAGIGGEQLRAEVAVYTRSMVDTVNALEKIGRLDIDGRLMVIREHQAEKVVTAVMAALDAVGTVLAGSGVDAELIAESRVRGREAAARELRGVTEKIG